MKIRFKTALAGADFSFGAGQVIEVDNDWATALISGGLAEGVEPDGEQDRDATGDGAGDTNRSKRISATRRK